MEECGRIAESYERGGKKLKVFKNVKQDKEGTVTELTTKFNKELKLLKKRRYTI